MQIKLWRGTPHKESQIINDPNNWWKILSETIKPSLPMNIQEIKDSILPFIEEPIVNFEIEKTEKLTTDQIS